MGGASDLKLTTAARIELNKGRERLYPELRDGFLLWWNKKRRWINEPFEPLEEKIGIHHPVPELGTIVKIENLIGLKWAVIQIELFTRTLVRFRR